MPESPKKTWQRVLGAAFTLALLVLVGWLTSRQLGDMDWADVSNAISSYSVLTLAVAFSAVLAGYAAVSQYDLVGRYYTGHSLPVRRVMAISFIGYTFSLNLGALIGGLGFRYRLYSKAELS
ncbi:MAG: YbhN family protein, partial [Halioglobus sp.]